MATEQTATSEEEQIRRIEELVRRMETIPDQESRDIAEQLMQAVLALHGAGLGRMMDLISESGSSGEATMRRFASDSVVSSLLVLHGLHPDDIETRVLQAVGKVPGHVSLVSVMDGVVRIRVSGGGCGSGTLDDESIKDALRQSVPDLTDIVIQHTEELNSFVPLVSLNGFSHSAG